MDFQMIENESPQGTIIKVVGVGGAGNNAVQHMINKGVQGVEFICLNTDAQALYRSSASHKLRLGKTGLGAGARPEVGKSSAEEAREEIKQLLAGAHMVFITAGMGGGTGTGAAPVVARIAKEMGILTVGVVSKPFEFEGLKRMNVAEIGANELQSHVDSLIIVLNERLFSVMGEDAEMDKCFECADDVLHNAVAGIAEIINVDGLINVDFEDVKTVMSEQGKAMMGTATISGQDRARLAAEDAVSSPLLEGVDLSGARGILVNITASRSLKLSETKQVMNTIRSYAAKDATVIFGSVYDESMGDALRVTVVATGLGGFARIPEQTSEMDLEKSIQYATHQLQDRHGNHMHGGNNHGPITINTFGAPPQNNHQQYNPVSNNSTPNQNSANTDANLNINHQPYGSTNPSNTSNNPLWNNINNSQQKATTPSHNTNNTNNVNKPNSVGGQTKESFEILAEVPAFLRNQKINNNSN
ncbi:MAG: Cell division protein ftsZ [Pseudomonadota bacterium]